MITAAVQNKDLGEDQHDDGQEGGDGDGDCDSYGNGECEWYLLSSYCRLNYHCLCGHFVISYLFMYISVS